MARSPVLADDDLCALADGALLDRSAELIRGRNRIDAELIRTIRVADARLACEHDGLKTMSSWLRNHTRLSAAVAAELVRSGRALAHLPALGAAFAAGDRGHGPLSGRSGTVHLRIVPCGAVRHGHVTGAGRG